MPEQVVLLSKGTIPLVYYDHFGKFHYHPGVGREIAYGLRLIHWIKTNYLIIVFLLMMAVYLMCYKKGISADACILLYAVMFIFYLKFFSQNVFC